jgi:hypothetical protein
MVGSGLDRFGVIHWGGWTTKAFAQVVISTVLGNSDVRPTPVCSFNGFVLQYGAILSVLSTL